MFHIAWPYETTRALRLSEFEERFRRYRLLVPEVECALADSLKRCGQMAPLVLCMFGGVYLTAMASQFDQLSRPENWF